MINISNENVPVIEYSSFGNSPERRLKILRGLAVIMSKPRGLHPPNVDEVSSDEWAALRSWLRNSEMSGEAHLFWRADARGIRVLRPCIGYILVGTEQMLQDLANSKVQIGLSEADMTFVSERGLPASNTAPQTSLSAIWEAARQYVAIEIDV